MIKYIDNNQQKGIQIDWNMIFREFRKLKTPIERYDPCELPIRECNWHVLLSERSVGKTTNILLIGLLLYKHYKIQTGYIRQYANMTTATKTRDLYNVVEEFRYLPKIFGEQWNSIYLWQKHIYLAKRDDMGNIIEKSNDPFCILLSVDLWATYKSTLTLPRCDWLVFDEFLSGKYVDNEFVHLCDVISTVRRNRISTKIICLSNMVQKYGVYLSEMGINHALESMKADESKIVSTPMGLKIYVKIIENVLNKDKKHVAANISYFGFANKQLQAITGAEWQIKNYPHLPRPIENETRELITRDIYVYAFSKYICVEFYNSNIIGNYVLFRPYELTTPDANSIIFTDQQPVKANEYFGIGAGTKLSKLWDLYIAHRDYYATNEIGYMIESYIDNVRRVR